MVLISLLQSLSRLRPKLLLSIAVIITAVLVKADFEPYVLNGGLVTAVAGRDYVILASDTRLMGASGYDILERNHVSSRLWTPVVYDYSTATTETPVSVATSDNEGDESFNIVNTNRNLFNADGSLCIDHNLLVNKDASSNDGIVLHRQFELLPPFPVMIASAGCQADCEALKRLMRAHFRTTLAWKQQQFIHTQGFGLSPNSLAQYLSNTLYQRRTFPFYSFCLCAGIDLQKSNGNNNNDKSTQSQGCVYVYDAIGSYERVATAANGVGKELMQPILDRYFRSAVEIPVDEAHSHYSTVALLRQKSQLFVDCRPEQALHKLVQAYRAVSEREIGVGDHIVLCLLRMREDNPDHKTTSLTCQIYSAPLRSH